MRPKPNRILSFLLAFVLFFMPLADVFAKDNKEIEKSDLEKLKANSIESMEEIKSRNDDKKIRVVVELEGKSVIEEANDMGVDIESLDKATVSKIEENLLEKQEEVKDELESKDIETTDEVDGKVKADSNYTKSFNGFATYVKAKDIKKIEKIKEVKEVHASNEYNKPSYSVNMETSNDMILSPKAWDLSYKGEGMVVSIIDSGIDPSHKDFKIDDGVDVALTEDKVSKLKEDKDLPGSYYTEKVPYAYNYYDLSDNVKDIGETQHGQHVAGTIAANGEIMGVAPNAQLLGMKVFSDDLLYSTTFSDIYMKAIEDSITLGADVINMSLGSVAGTYIDSTLEDVALKNATENGIVCSISAGNEHTIVDGVANFSDIFTGEYPYAYSKNPDIGTLGSPSVYPWSLSVASIENTHQKTHKLVYTINDKKHEVATSPADGAPNAWDVFDGPVSDIVEVKALEGGAPGDIDSFKNTDVKGKIALVERGNTFTDTIANAMQAGATAVIIYNNEREDEETLINMAGGEIAEIPFMMIGRSAGVDIANNINNGVTIEFPEDLMTIENPNANQLSEFSSWGTTPDLQIKPEISAPGGMIYSTQNDNGYTTMSGTSMAAPHVSGGSALVNERLKRKDSPFGELSPSERSHLAKILLMNNADVIKDPDNISYLVREQGAGMMNLEKALTSEVYVVEKNSNEAKAELLDFEDSKFDMTFVLTNVSSEDKSFDINAELLTDLILEGNGKKYNVESPKPLDFDIQSEGNITVKANSSYETTVTINFKKAIDDKQIERNNFVDGFVYFSSDKENLSVPFMGFYGDWEEPSILDSPSYNLNDDDLSNDPMFNKTGLVAVDEEGNAVELPSNPAYFNPESPYNTITLSASILRNLDRIEFSITDKDYNELYNIGQASSRIKINSMSQGAYPYEIFNEGLWNGRINNDTIKEGDSVFYTVKAYRTKDSKPQTMKFELRVDKDEPLISDLAYKDNSLTFKASDATSGLMDFILISVEDFENNNYDNLIYFDAKDSLVEGNINDGKFKLDIENDLNKGNYYVLADDFANNMGLEEFEVSLEDAKLPSPKIEPVYTTSDKITGNSDLKGDIIVYTKDNENLVELASAKVNDDLTFEVPIEKQEEGTKLFVTLKLNDKESDPSVVVVEDNKLKPVEITTKVSDKTTLIMGNALRANVDVNMYLKEGEEYTLLDTTKSNEDGSFVFELEKAFEKGTVLAFDSKDKDLVSEKIEITVDEAKEKELSEYGQAEFIIESPGLLEGYNSDVDFNGTFYGWDSLDSLKFGDKDIAFTENEKMSVTHPETGEELFYGKAFTFEDSLSLDEGYYEIPLTAKSKDEEFSVVRRFFVDYTNPTLGVSVGEDEFMTSEESSEFIVYTDKESVAVDLSMKDNLNSLYLYKGEGLLKMSDITATEGFKGTNIEDSTKDMLYLDLGDNIYNYWLEDESGNYTQIDLNVFRTDKSQLEALIDRANLLLNKPDELVEAIDKASEILDKENATVDEINSAIDLLEQSLEELPQEPMIYGVNDFDVYTGDVVDKQRLLKDVIAFDYQDGDITDSIIINPESVDTSKVGETTVEYEVTDSDNNTTKYSIIVNVVERPKDPVDFSSLKALIAKALDYSESNYTKSSYDSMIEFAKESLNYLSDEYSQEEIDNRKSQLQEKIDQLVYIGDLKALVEEIEDLDLSKYTKESTENLKSNLEKAKKLLEDENASKEDIQQMIKLLEESVSNLEENNKLDKSKLDELYNKLKDTDLKNYTEKSKKEFEQALMLAKTVLDDENTSQEIVDKAYDRLNEAYLNLEEKEQSEKVDKEKLQKLYDECKKMDLEGYSKSLKEEFNKALENARSVLEDKNANQKQIEKAYNLLLKAKENLEKDDQSSNDDKKVTIKEANNSSNKPNSSNNSSSSSNNAKTGVTVSMISIGLLASSSAGLYFIRRKRK